MKKRSHHAPKVLTADTGDSTAISDLRWKSGTAFFTFARDGYKDSAEMDRETFEEWVDSGSLGGWYNANLR
jgi:hypothetical protein